jgi:hypothetical protein
MCISIEGCRAAAQTKSQAMTQTSGSDSKCRGIQIWNAEVRILPPQPASPSLTHTESGSARIPVRRSDADGGGRGQRVRRDRRRLYLPQVFAGDDRGGAVTRHII